MTNQEPEEESSEEQDQISENPNPLSNSTILPNNYINPISLNQFSRSGTDNGGSISPIKIRAPKVKYPYFIDSNSEEDEDNSEEDYIFPRKQSVQVNNYIPDRNRGVETPKPTLRKQGSLILPTIYNEYGDEPESIGSPVVNPYSENQLERFV